MNRMRKVLRIVLGIASVIAVPIFIDFFVFGNAFPSNIDNQAWAGFLGSYLGGIATLVAVFITISDNNKKIEIQRQSEKEQLAEQKKYAVFYFRKCSSCFVQLSKCLSIFV